MSKETLSSQPDQTSLTDKPGLIGDKDQIDRMMRAGIYDRHLIDPETGDVFHPETYDPYSNRQRIPFLNSHIKLTKEEKRRAIEEYNILTEGYKYTDKDKEEKIIKLKPNEAWGFVANTAIESQNFYTNKPGDPIHLYKKDKYGNFLRDERGNKIVDNTVPTKFTAWGINQWHDNRFHIPLEGYIVKDGYIYQTRKDKNGHLYQIRSQERLIPDKDEKGNTYYVYKGNDKNLKLPFNYDGEMPYSVGKDGQLRANAYLDYMIRRYHRKVDFDEKQHYEKSDDNDEVFRQQAGFILYELAHNEAGTLKNIESDIDDPNVKDAHITPEDQKTGHESGLSRKNLVNLKRQGIHTPDERARAGASVSYFY